MQDAIQAASELSALGGDASAASADPDAPENPADEIALTEALARAFGHIQRADAAGNIVLVQNLTRKLSYWRRALRGLDSPPDDIEWCRALVLLHLHDTSFAALQAVENKGEEKLVANGWEHSALLLELLRMFGHQLGLGPDAQTLLTGIRNAKGIRKPSTGPIEAPFGKASYNLLRRSGTEQRCMPTFVEAFAAVHGKVVDLGPQLRDDLLGSFMVSSGVDGAPNTDADELAVEAHLQNWHTTRPDGRKADV